MDRTTRLDVELHNVISAVVTVAADTKRAFIERAVQTELRRVCARMTPRERKTALHLAGNTSAPLAMYMP